MTRKRSRSLMVCGTTSDAGKSFLVTGLCRSFARRGYAVAPFKAQNMASNASVTPLGFEMSMAQALQAEAAKATPDPRFNPVLLKPLGDSRSRIVVNGTFLRDADARAYHGGICEEVWIEAKRSLEALRNEFDIVVAEGAGSPAEMNLYDMDITNMRVARELGAPVLLACDIERGGAIASLIGTLAVMPQRDADLVKAFIVNRFRGDRSLFDDGVKFLERFPLHGRPVLGILPHAPSVRLPAEDSLDMKAFGHGDVAVAVIALPRIANFSDFDSFADDGCRVIFARDAAELAGADLIVVPASQSPETDVAWMEGNGFAEALRRAADGSQFVWGIAQGCWMLARSFPGASGDAQGLGLLPIDIERAEAITSPAKIFFPDAAESNGFLLDAMRTRYGADVAPLATIEAGGETFGDGASAHGGRVVGLQAGGLADDAAFRRRLVDAIREKRGLPRVPHPPRAGAEIRDAGYDTIADFLEEYLDMRLIDSLIGWDS